MSQKRCRKAGQREPSKRWEVMTLIIGAQVALVELIAAVLGAVRHCG
ncbi:hypothetical protein SAMN05421874_11298 [Nonomuraea maritima]|uniref:Uncharacterized protein n=1 Tax=Nonomuraea maritima TaxID=683260 RepID=A0A1G9FHZ9_9ACTN|nr:hypothetical protein SAMN05421874_11298 [Nonomuraea maritima]